MSRINSSIHPALSEEVLKCLFTKQIYTVSNFLNMNIHRIKEITNLTFQEIRTIKQTMIKKYSAAPKSALDYYKSYLKQSAIVPSNIQGIDKLLEGGFFTGNIYEICGRPNCGKTQLLLTIIATIASKFGQVFLINTKRNSTELRLKTISSSLGDAEEATKILKNILIYNITTRYELIKILYKIKSDFENGLHVRLIAIDSLPPLIMNSENIVENNSFLNQISSIIRYLCTEYHLIFIIINVTTTWNDNKFSDRSQKNSVDRILCGKYWRKTINTRIKIDKNKNEKFSTLSISESDTLLLSNSCVKFVISDSGVREV